MGYTNTTTITCDSCSADLEATSTNTAEFLTVASTPRVDANKTIYPTTPAISATLCFCNVACLTAYINKTTTGA
jgi:hypothetical protein